MEKEKIIKRWQKYRNAMSIPNIRNNEINMMFKYVNPQKGEIILEQGPGNGILTFKIAKKIGNGKIIIYDAVKENLMDIIDKNNKLRLNIEVKYLESDPKNYRFFEMNESIDKVISIAGFHHCDNRDKRTGIKGRKKILEQAYKILKKEGKVIIADIAQGTISQKYFDELIDNKKSKCYCQPEGHPHTGIDNKILKIIKEVGFKNITYKKEFVSWQFKDSKQAKEFFYNMHNPNCSKDYLFDQAKKYLNWRKTNKGYKMDWELGFLRATK